ncbi:unnamed protein product [Ilex paraguariensis]|uniref:Small ribosomal subunit protein uS17 N-terminal domain-containing protein n=1 Tax=Ilex paraguariensis TaxID=185542 RepID=A0ABC8RLY4_9AQUA
MVSTKSVYEPNEVIGLNTILKAHETVVSTKIGYDPENVKELGTTNMAEQTEKAFLKQPKVFLCSKKSGKGKRPGKGGNRYWKSIGLGFKTPREAIEGLFGGPKLLDFEELQRNYLRYVKKYQRYEKRHSKIPAHISPCFCAKEGDHIIIGQCRPLSMMVRFNVLKVIPAGSSGGGKKAFTGM